MNGQESFAHVLEKKTLQFFFACGGQYRNVYKWLLFETQKKQKEYFPPAAGSTFSGKKNEK
jgi:hypothetical protein